MTDPHGDASHESFPLADHARRYRAWLKQLKAAELLPREHLIPQLLVPVDGSTPALMRSREDMSDDERASLRERVEELAPWEPYSIALGRGLYTSPEGHERMVYRSHLITGAVRKLCDVNGATAIDLACNHGYFGLELASLGARVTGMDLRPVNVEKALLLKRHFRVENAGFRVQNAYDAEGEFDIVYNLGLLYHVTDPFELIAKTYTLTRQIAVVDTVTHHSPLAAYVQRPTKDATNHAEGRYEVELHPTYRAVIDLMHAVGFRDLMEVRPDPAVPGIPPYPAYEKLERRCLVGRK